MRWKLHWAIWVLCGGLTLIASEARSTYSIVAVHSESSEVGGGGTSCVHSLSVEIIYGSVPGVGAVHAQANLNLDGRDEAVGLLELGTSPADILLAITDPGFDPNAASRQYGVVDLLGRAAGWTGGTNLDYADDLQGTVDAYTYSVQGNILTGPEVLTQAETAFRGDGCDLAERLMRALEAGAEGGHGDSRCTGDGIPSDSAFIQVDLPDGTPHLFLSLSSTAPASPLPLLRQHFDYWRTTHPCPGSAPDAGAPDAGAPDAGAPDAGPDASLPFDGAVGPDASPDSGEADSGCACHSSTVPGFPPALVTLTLLLLVARRRRGQRSPGPGNRQC